MAEAEKPGFFSRMLVSDTILFRSQTITEIIGRKQISVQGLRDIMQFSPQEVRLQTDSGIIRVAGDALTVTILTQDSIELKGTIRMVILEQGETEHSE